MKIRKVRVTGSKARCLPDDATDFTHEVNLTNAKYPKAVHDNYFKVVDGEPVEKTQDDLDADQLVTDKANWETERDNILNSAYVTYKGFYVDMSPESKIKFTEIRDTLSRRNKKANWKAKKVSTGKYQRVQIGRADIDAISDAVFDASQIIHEAADTGMPVNPWPLNIS